MSATASAVWVHAVCQALAARGLDPQAFYSGLGLPSGPATPLDQRVPIERYFELWARAMRAVRDARFPRDVARHRVEDFELVGFLLATSPTVGVALDQGVRLQRLWFSTGGWRVAKASPSLVTLVWSPLTPVLRGDLGERCAYESIAMAMLQGMARLSGTSVSCERLELAHARAAGVEEMFHEAGFRNVQFGSKRYALCVCAEVLERPIPKAHPPLAAYLAAQCEALLSKHDSLAVMAMAERVRSLLLETFSASAFEHSRDVATLTMSWVASKLAMTERTLRRRLRDEGVDFRGLVDEIRSLLAVQHLQCGRLTVAEIAFLLGFQSLSAFHRAFRRWTKHSPARFRTLAAGVDQTEATVTASPGQTRRSRQKS